MNRIFGLAPGLATVSLVLVCLTAMLFDARYRRLPNWLTLGALLIALALRLPDGWNTVGSGLASAALAFVLGVPFFLVGGLGGGDVKLMAGLAAFLDPRALIPALVVMALAGGAMAVIAAMRKRTLRRVLGNIGAILLSFVTLGQRSLSGWQGRGGMRSSRPVDANAVTSPYGVAIAAGALAGWLLG